MRRSVGVLFFGMVLVGAGAGGAFGQATAPVTTGRHTHHHNEAHPKVYDERRFHTDREGATLYLPAEEDAFAFVVFGDRTGGPNEGVDVLAEAVADVNLIEPDLVMTVGDLVQGYNQTADWLAQMEQFKSIMGELLCPWFPVAGNHDIYWRGPNKPEGEHEKNYEIHFGPLWYAFEHKNCWFIVLYSDEGDPATGEKAIGKAESQRMSPEQYAWLRDTLANKTRGADHVFLFLHHPRWTGGQYGDDWDKVHELLVGAGNVSAVFAGHIHRMRYDPKDGIEYVTLATVGGHQRGVSPEAGYLHQYHMVTVREDQIALSSVPVGEIMDVRAITGEVSEAAEALSQMEASFARRPAVGYDGGFDSEMVVSVTNPVGFKVDIELRPESEDSRWTVWPDHDHGTLEPNETRSFTFRVTRPTGAIDAFLRPIGLRVAADLLTNSARFPVEPSVVMVPGTLVLPEPRAGDRERALRVARGDAASGAVVDMASLGLESGALTVEAWVRPDGFAGREGVVGSGGFGLWLDDGRPVFSVRLGRRWVEAGLASGLTLREGRWYHLAGVYDGAEVRLFIDGRLAGAVAAGEGALRVLGSPVVIGGDSSGEGPRNVFSGLIDEVRVSGTARYAVAEFAPERRQRADAYTRLLLHMDGSIGAYLYDTSSSEAHPTLVGGAAVVGVE